MEFKLSDGNQTELLLKPEKKSSWIDETIKEHPWEEYHQFNNRLEKYIVNLFDPLMEQQTVEDEGDFWNKLNIGQKLFLNYLVFEGESSNSSIFNFFWGRSEYADVTLELLKLPGFEKLSGEYNEVYQRFLNLKDKFNELKNSIDPQKENWEEEYADAYNHGLSLLGESRIEQFYQDGELRFQFHKAICDFIENNRHYFVEN